MAFVIDSTIILMTFILSGLAVSKLGLPTPIRIAIPTGLIFILDPLLVATMGMTIGHRIMGMRICKQDSLRKLNILEATLRFIVKVFFGWLSLVSVLITQRHQAIHDMAVKSLVIIANPEKFEDHEKLTERIDEKREGWTYPSKKRRVIVIFVYLLLVYYLIGIGIVLLTFLLWEVIGLQSHYSEMVPNIIGGIALIASTFHLVQKGWRGQLWGCRLRRLENSDEVSD